MCSAPLIGTYSIMQFGFETAVPRSAAKIIKVNITHFMIQYCRQ